MNKTAKSFGIVTSFSVATRLASFIFKMWMSRSLGAEIVGLYQIALSTLLMLFTITAGAPTVLSRKIAEASGNLKKQNSLATASMIMGLCISAAICALFFGLGKKISPLFSNPDCLPIFFIMLPTLLTSTLYASLRSWFWGRKKFVAFSSTELVDEIVKIVLSIVFTGGLLSWLDGAQSIALAMTISDLACVVILIILFFLSGGRLTKPSGFKDLTLKTIPLSATRIITSLGASLTAYILPKMLVKSGLTLAEATAQYGRVSGMALPLIMAPVAFISALSVVFVPDVAESRSKGDMDAVRAKMATSMLFAIVIACLFFVVYLPLGQSLGLLLFKDKEAGKFVSYCSFMLFPIATAQATTPMLNSLGKEQNTLLNTIVGAVAMIPCVLFMPKYIGVYAMALSTGTCFLLIAILNLIVLKKEVGSFINHKKNVPMILLSVPLAVTGLFAAKLLCNYADYITAIVVVGVYVLFFFFLIVSAFNVVDVTACVKMFAPSHEKPAKIERSKNAQIRKIGIKNTPCMQTMRMLNLFIRCLILYFVLLIAMRLMGKRQLGELQPFELAITLVASDLVCIPMADSSIPILYGIIPVFSLFLVHIIITKLATKSIKFRKFLNGKPIIIIQNGNIMPDVMKELNLNIDDIMEALRGAGCFNPSEVEYAILETNGNMSVLQKSANRPLSPSDVQLNPPKAEIPVTVIMEGEFVAENVATLEGNVKEDVLAYLNDIEMKQEDVLVLLLAGQDVFIQPYKGHFITATINSSADSSDDGNGCNNDSNNDSNGDCEQQNSCAEKQDELCDSQKADKAFSLFHGGEKQ